MRRLSTPAVCLLCLLSVSGSVACGDDENLTTNPPSWPGSNLPGSSKNGGSGSKPSPKLPPGEYCAEVSNWDADWAERESRVLALVNAERAKGASCGGKSFGPASPLEMDGAMQCAARHHSKNMAEMDFFSHTGPDGDTPGDRLKAAGYTGGGWGENIAGGSQTPEDAMKSWMGSSGHCSNIMNPGYRKIGVGYHPGGDNGHLWTQTFGG
jgi:uncharacterized protein YkwD